MNVAPVCPDVVAPPGQPGSAAGAPLNKANVGTPGLVAEWFPPGAAGAAGQSAGIEATGTVDCI